MTPLDGIRLSVADLFEIKAQRKAIWDKLYNTKGRLGVLEWGEIADDLDRILREILDSVMTEDDL